MAKDIHLTFNIDPKLLEKLTQVESRLLISIQLEKDRILVVQDENASDPETSKKVLVSGHSLQKESKPSRKGRPKKRGRRPNPVNTPSEELLQKIKTVAKIFHSYPQVIFSNTDIAFRSGKPKSQTNIILSALKKINIITIKEKGKYICSEDLLLTSFEETVLIIKKHL